MITFEELIYPMTDEVFNTTVKGKKPMVFRATDKKKNVFGNIVTWKQFSDYINNDRAVAGLQVIQPDRTKLCMERGNLHRDPQPSWTPKRRFERKYLHELWNGGSSIILTKASMFSREISAIGGALEARYPGTTAADAHFYCSPNSRARSFECHCDRDDNYLVHAIGKVHWKVYDKRIPWRINPESGRIQLADGPIGLSEAEEAQLEPIIDTVLGVGDLLYIPAGVYHRAVPVGPRISISVPLMESRKEYPLDREYYDFSKNIS